MILIKHIHCAVFMMIIFSILGALHAKPGQFLLEVEEDDSLAENKMVGRDFQVLSIEEREINT